MRKREQEIRDKESIEQVINKAQTCRLGLCDGEKPYVVPLCFGYEGGLVYVHSAREGRKLDILKANPKVCVEFEGDVEIVKAARPCDWSVTFKSVIADGTASFITDGAAKAEALNIIMKKYAGETYDYPKETLEQTAILRIALDAVTGKKSREP